MISRHEAFVESKELTFKCCDTGMCHYFGYPFVIFLTAYFLISNSNGGGDLMSTDNCLCNNLLRLGGGGAFM